MVYDSIVIGKGLMGCAAAKYLGQFQKNVAIIGPDEEMAVNEGIIFSSHYDQARIQRIIGKDATWTLLNQQSIDQYASLEEETKIIFHSKVGCLYVNPYGTDKYLDNVPEQAKLFNKNYRLFQSGGSIHESFPDLHFPEAAKGMFEPSPSGHINPRLLIKAQLHVFEKNGGEIFNDTANEISYENGIIKINTIGGRVYYSKKVLLAPGAFVNFLNILKRKLVLNLKSETTILVKAGKEEAQRLSGLPSLLYSIDEPEIQDIYLVRPVQYPDGEYYFKMGANFPNDIYFNSLREVQDWFKAGNSNCDLEVMQNALQAIMPSVSLKECLTKRCIISYTQHGKPYIGAVDNEGLFVATGGNGYSAMCSDALGKIAATLLLEEAFPKEFSSQSFQPVFAD